MIIKFWGTRGSIPVPSKKTVKYGGNTSCVELQSSHGECLILDAGTGISEFGSELEKKLKGKPFHGSILIGHTHWDHIQGLPFFDQLFVKGAVIDVYGPLGFQGSIVEALSGQMDNLYFPVKLEDVLSKVNYHDITEESFYINDIHVTTCYLNHTTVTIGYRIEVDGYVLVYSTDHEPSSLNAAKGQIKIVPEEAKHINFLEDADVVIHDAQYIASEYPTKLGWGHSTIEYAIKVCQLANVKQLFLTHHEPKRSDDEIDALRKSVISKKMKKSNMVIEFAKEGMKYEFNRRNDISKDDVLQRNRRNPKKKKIQLEELNVITVIKSTNIEKKITGALNSLGVHYRALSESDSIDNGLDKLKLSLIILENKHPATKKVKQWLTKMNKHQCSLLLVGEGNKSDFNNQKIIIHHLNNFTLEYAKYCITKLLLKEKIKWIIAELPENESIRIQKLQNLNLLDTPKSEIFEKITGVCADVFKVPISIISLVDVNRQWFLSSDGLDAKQTSREVSFCSHVVANHKSLVVHDALLDDRFAENPLVIGRPHIRFYAGYPLKFENVCLGTLCLIDFRPRNFSIKQLKALGAIRDLTMECIKKGFRSRGMS